MSKYRRIKTEYRDRKALESALNDLGVPFESGTNLTMYGYMGDARPERADVVIRRQHISHASNDLGFARQPDGVYEAIVSEFDSTQARAVSYLQQIKARYAYHALVNAARSKGYAVRELSNSNGVVRLQLVQYR